MTIAAGFRCNEGIVLCADTEETFWDIKQWRGKIVTSAYPRFQHVVCFAGAGWTNYIQAAIEKAQDGLSECNGMSEILAHLEETLVRFFEGHLANWASFPQAERPSIELLIGVTTRAGPFGLFYYGGTAFHSTHEKAIGSGSIVANNLISELRFHTESLDDLCRLAVFVLSKVKKQVVGCGGDTHLVALKRGGDFALVESDDMRRLEAELEEKGRSSNVKLKEAINACSPLRLSWLSEAEKKRPRPEPFALP